MIDMDQLFRRSLKQSKALQAHNLWRMSCAVSATLQVFTPEWFLMEPLVDWEILGTFMMYWCSWSRSCCPDCSACSGVVVEGRVNEQSAVLVVRGKSESNKE